MGGRRRGEWHAVVAVTVLLSACARPDEPAATASTVLETNAELVRVVDGDTIVVEIDGQRQTVRLIGIDTPESVKPDSPVECFGPEASAFTNALLPAGTALHLERDVEARDDYGRLLAYVYLAADGTFVNLEIVRQGYASLLTFPPNVAHVDDFVASAQSAQQANLGLWAGCSG
jgi:micrococcal nuclease